MYKMYLLIIFNLLYGEVTCQNYLDGSKFNPVIQHRIFKSPDQGNDNLYMSNRRSLFDYLPSFFQNPVNALLSPEQEFAAQPQDVEESLRAERRGDHPPNQLSKEQIENHIKQLKKFNTYKLHNIYIPTPGKNQELKEQRIYIANPLESNFPASFTWAEYQEIMKRRIQESYNRMHNGNVTTVIVTSERSMITENESGTYEYDEDPSEVALNTSFDSNDDEILALTTERSMITENENVTYEFDEDPSEVASNSSFGNYDDEILAVATERPMITENESVIYEYDDEPSEVSSNSSSGNSDDVIIAVTTERPMIPRNKILRYKAAPRKIITNSSLSNNNDVIIAVTSERLTTHPFGTPSEVISKTSHVIDDVVRVGSSERAMITEDEKVTFDNKNNTPSTVKGVKMSEKAKGSEVDEGINFKKLLRSGDNWEMEKSIQKLTIMTKENTNQNQTFGTNEISESGENSPVIYIKREPIEHEESSIAENRNIVEEESNTVMKLDSEPTENNKKLVEVTSPRIQGDERAVTKDSKQIHDEGETETNEEALTTSTTDLLLEAVTTSSIKLLPEAVTTTTTKLLPLQKPMTFITGGTRDYNDFAYN